MFQKNFLFSPREGRQLLLTLAITIVLAHSQNASARYLIGVNYNIYKRCEITATDPGGMNNKSALTDYHLPGVRPLVQSHLRAMRDSYSETMATIVHFTSWPGPRRDGVISISDQSLRQQYLLNLDKYIRDVRDAGYSRFTIRFNPLGLNSPVDYVRDWTKSNPQAPTPPFNPSYTVINYEFIDQVRKATKKYQTSTFQVYYDLQVEVNTAVASQDSNARWYFPVIWARYVRENGRTDASASLGVGWYDTSKTPAVPEYPTSRWRREFGDVLKAFQNSGAGYPQFHLLMYYHSSLSHLTSPELLDIASVMNERALSYDQREIRIIESFYNHGPTSAVVWNLNRFHGFNITEVSIWPMRAEDLFKNDCQQRAELPYRVDTLFAVRANGFSESRSGLLRAGYYAPNREYWAQFWGQAGSFPLFVSLYDSQGNLLRASVGFRWASAPWETPMIALTSTNAEHFRSTAGERLQIRIWQSDGSVSPLFRME